jgi:hypothetical protein
LIIQEVEQDMYDVGKILKIQSFVRMKKQQLQFRKMKAAQRSKQG